MFLFMVQFFDFVFVVFIYWCQPNFEVYEVWSERILFSRLNWKFVFAIKLWAMIVLYRSKLHHSYILDKKNACQRPICYWWYRCYFSVILLRISQSFGLVFFYFAVLCCTNQSNTLHRILASTRIHVWDYALTYHWSDLVLTT